MIKLILDKDHLLNTQLNYFIKKIFTCLVQDKFDNFRKIRDHENNTGWVHIFSIIKKKAALTIDDDQLIFNKPSTFILNL